MKKFCFTILIVIGAYLLFLTPTILKNKFTPDESESDIVEVYSKLVSNLENYKEELWNENLSIKDKKILIVKSTEPMGIMWKNAYAFNMDRELVSNLFSKKSKKKFNVNGISKNVYRIWYNTPDFVLLTRPATYGNIKYAGKHIGYLKFHHNEISNNENEIVSNFIKGIVNMQCQDNFGESEEEYTYNFYSVYFNKPDLLANSITEMEILKQAEKVDDIEKIKSYLKEYILLREYKNSKDPRLEDEKLSELIRGVPQYIVNEYFSLTKGQTHTYSDYSNDLESFERGKNAKYFFKDIMYEKSGALICKLLDKINVEWKEQVAGKINKNSETPYDILKKNIVFNNDDANKIDYINKKYNYDINIEEASRIMEIIKTR